MEPGSRLPAEKEAPGAARPCTSTLACRDVAGVMGWRGPPRGDWAAMRGARESCKEGAAEPRVGEGNQHREGRTDWGLPPGSGIDLCSPRVSISTIFQRLGGGQGGLERVSANLQPMPLSQTSRGLCRGPLARPRGT